MVATHQQGDAICVTADGEIDMTTADEFTDEFTGAVTGAVTAAINQRPTRIIIDLIRLRFMDSSGIAALIRARRIARNSGTSLLVINCQPRIRRIMEVTGGYELLTQTAPDRPAAADP